MPDQTRRRLWLVPLAILSLSLLSLPHRTLMRAEASLPVTDEWGLQGRVYDGDVGDQSRPIERVEVRVYGANAADLAPHQGVFIRSDLTDADGFWRVPVYDDDGNWEYYYVGEVDPEGYDSVGATTVSGIVRAPNWVEIEPPLPART